jgi:hypothetical protein
MPAIIRVRYYVKIAVPGGLIVGYSEVGPQRASGKSEATLKELTLR